MAPATRVTVSLMRNLTRRPSSHETWSNSSTPKRVGTFRSFSARRDRDYALQRSLDDAAATAAAQQPAPVDFEMQSDNAMELPPRMAGGGDADNESRWERCCYCDTRILTFSLLDHVHNECEAYKLSLFVADRVRTAYLMCIYHTMQSQLYQCAVSMLYKFTRRLRLLLVVGTHTEYTHAVHLRISHCGLQLSTYSSFFIPATTSRSSCNPACVAASSARSATTSSSTLRRATTSSCSSSSTSRRATTSSCRARVM